MSSVWTLLISSSHWYIVATTSEVVQSLNNNNNNDNNNNNNNYYYYYYYYYYYFLVSCHTPFLPPWTKVIPTAQASMFQPTVLSVLRVMFQEQPPFVPDLLNSFFVWLANVSLSLVLSLRWLQLLQVWSHISNSTLSLYISSSIAVFFLLPLAWYVYSCSLLLSHLHHVFFL